MPSDAQRRIRGDGQRGIVVDDVDHLVPDILRGLALHGCVEQFGAVDCDLDLLPARERGRLLGLVELRVRDVDRKLLVELEMPAAVDADRRGVADAFETDQVQAAREDQDSPGEGIRHVEVLPVVRHRGRGSNAARTLRFGELDEVGLADHEVCARTVLRRDPVVDQDAVVAGIRHEQAAVHREGEAREVQGALAASRIAGHVRVDLAEPGRKRHSKRHVRGRRLVLAAATVVVERADRLAQRLAVVGHAR